MAIISKGYLRCKRCGTLFTVSINSAPCYFNREYDSKVEVADEGVPSEDCAVCKHFTRYRNEKPKCPACGSEEVRKASGVRVRLSRYFRK